MREEVRIYDQTRISLRLFTEPIGKLFSKMAEW